MSIINHNMVDDEYRTAIKSILASGRGWNAIEDISKELGRKDEILHMLYDDATAKINAINAIARSNQPSEHKLDGIKALSDSDPESYWEAMGGSEEE